MRQNHRTLGAALVAREAQRYTILRRERVHHRSARPQCALLTRRSIRIERGGPREDAAVGFKQRAREELAKASYSLQALLSAGRVGHLHGGNLFGEIRGRNLQNAHAGHGAVLVVLAQRYIERAGVVPDLSHSGLVNHLEAVEVPALAFLRDQGHAVHHVARLYLVRIDNEELEDAAIDGQGFGGKSRGQHRARHTRLVPWFGEHAVDVIAADGEREL